MSSSMVNEATGFPGLNEILAGQQVVQMEEPILLNTSTITPLLSYTTRLKQTRTVQNIKFSWLTDDIAPMSVALSADYAYTDDHMHVTAGMGKYFTPRAVFVGKNGIQYRVALDTDGVTPKITYASSSEDLIYIEVFEGNSATHTATTLAAGNNMSIGDKLFILPTSVTDKADALESFHDDPVIVSNFIQNFQSAVSITDIANKIELYGGNPRQLDHEKRQKEIAVMMELAFLLGKPWDPGVSSTTGATSWATGGARQSLTTNAFNLSNAVISIDKINEKVPFVTKYSNLTELALFVTSPFLSLFSATGNAKLQLRPDDTKWGFQPLQLITAFGPIDLIHEKALDEWWGGSTTTAGCEAFLLNMNEYKKVQFTDGGIKMLPNRQNPREYQKVLDIYVSRQGLQWGRECRSGYFYNWKTA